MAIASALGVGLAQVANKLVEKGVVEPALQPATEWLAGFTKRHHEQAKEDEALQNAVQKALLAIGAPEGSDALEQYVLHFGFDKLQAEGNSELREEMARAALLMTRADPQLVPPNLFQLLRWPRDRRPLLAQFLFHLRKGLETHKTWGSLIEQANKEAIRDYLHSLAFDLAEAKDTLGDIRRYVHNLLAYYELAPGVDDAQALEEYVQHVAQVHRSISFLFVKPAGRRDQLRTEAELDTVFVPLQVQDPAAEKRPHHHEKRLQLEVIQGEEDERQQTLTINEVLAKHPVFLLKGAPGCGKTTLLRHLATSFARGRAAEQLDWTAEPLLPILVPLRNFGRFLTDHHAEYTNPAPQALRRFIEDYFREYELELPPSFFLKRLKQGRCLVLLDGLDEVADRDLRSKVARIVTSFITHYADKGNRFGLASRPRGYEEVAHYLPRPMICTVEPLLPETRDRLVFNLLRQFTSSEQRCRQEAQELLRDIANKRRVDELSRNPLFCTTLVLVYKYRGTTLPERRVDVYQELVNLMLGFWETHREGVADVRELALMDGTGRPFMDEGEAVEAKERALIELADWMQQRQQAEVDKEETVAHLAKYFADREGATEAEKESWARGFLDVAHQRSGLFIEVEPDTYAFSHQNFREYLAATALVNRTDQKMVEMVLAHAADAWWEEVILLAAAHERLSPQRRELLLEAMLDKGHLVLAGRCAVDAGARLPAPLRRQIQEKLYGQMTDAALAPKERYAAGEALDELGWLPEDLNDWVRCPDCTEDGGDLMAMKYPVTNSHFERFIEAGGYEEPGYWGGEASEAWQRRVDKHNEQRRGKDPVTEPEYWQQVRLGKERRGYPVVGVSWYEATAYAAWLTDLLYRAHEGNGSIKESEQELVAYLLSVEATEVRLPTEAEWAKMAGGDGRERYPWDEAAVTTAEDNKTVLSRANTYESGIKGTSPVAMYPQGCSYPFKLMDLAGNVWEWTNSWYDEDKDGRVVRGGSWNSSAECSRVPVRRRGIPDGSYVNIGFRLVSPVGSGS